MNLNNQDLIKLKNDGFIIKRSNLSLNEINKIKSIILKHKVGKQFGVDNYSVNFKEIFFKLFKLEIRKFFQSLYLIKIEKLLGIQTFLSNLYQKKVDIVRIDGYRSPTDSNKDIIPWHTDQSYDGSNFVEKIKSPNYFFYKTILYLTDVNANNGCTSYIPGSHKITYALRYCFYKKILNYKPFHKLVDLVKILELRDYYNEVSKILESKELLNQFLTIAKECLKNNNSEKFSFEAKAGDVIIFNECGFHKGSKPSLNERIILRFFYLPTNIKKY